MTTAAGTEYLRRGKRICVAFDGSEHATKALTVGKALLQPRDHLWIFTAAPVVAMELTNNLGPDLLAALEAKRDENLRQMMDECRAKCADVPQSQVSVESGEPGAGPREALHKFVEAQGIDLLILGSRGYSGLHRMLLGSVSSYAVAHADCHVLIVK